VLPQHLLVQEQQRRQACLCVDGDTWRSVASQVRKASTSSPAPALGRVAQAVEADEGAHPMHVGLFGAQAVVQVADLLAQRVEQRAGA
jgi:hypothetical protein